jgi:hypothetical protein
MDHEHPERQHGCDHDDDVMCTHRFFDKTLRAHLDRQRLHTVMDAKRHWIFAITPECGPLFLKLQQLNAERGAMQDVEVLTLPTLPMAPILVCVPRDQLSLDDLADVVDFNRGSREVYESKAYITISTVNTDVVNQALSNWINLDHLLS